MDQQFNWNLFLQPYELAINGFIIKLESMKKQYVLKGKKNPIELITGRVKTPSSILEKAKRLNVGFHEIEEKIQDIGGIRITCKYESDVYHVYDLLSTRRDIEVILIKDYIKNPKSSGYRSLHLIVKYVVETLEGAKSIYLEFQIRTLAMHLWATIEHSLKYKYYRNIPENVKARLLETAKITAMLDVEMTKLQQEVETQENDHEDYELEWDINTIRRGNV
ncbi:MAG: GTP pyrophosphokinase family protein [Bacilli bacterium]